MANWHGIDGIEFHYGGPWSDSEITFNDVRDTAGVTVEETMWERYVEDGGDETDFDAFSAYMQEHADEVKELILVARGELEY